MIGAFALSEPAAGTDAANQQATATPAGDAPPRRLTVEFHEVKAPAQPAAMNRNADPLQDMHDRYSLGDYTGALGVAEAILDEDPQNGEAAECADNCRSVLKQMYTARLGPLDRDAPVAVQVVVNIHVLIGVMHVTALTVGTSGYRTPIRCMGYLGSRWRFTGPSAGRAACRAGVCRMPGIRIAVVGRA